MKNKELLNKIFNILKESKSYVSRSVNYAQIVSNWLIGRYIVESEQKGDKSAEYGSNLIKFLSEKLKEEFGSGYNQTNLKQYRSFYLLYQEVIEANENDFAKGHSLRDELKDDIALSNQSKNSRALSDNFANTNNLSYELKLINEFSNHPLNKLLKYNLSWTHHRILLKVENSQAREFYLKEASENYWSTRALDRQINSFYYERIISSQNKDVVKQEADKKINQLIPQDVLKDPMVLEFLQLKKDTHYLESDLEQALLDNLSDFLLELGSGFAFVCRQKHIRTQTKDYYIDLVFYHYILKCFVLIDLKTRELNHKDIGQMDMYVRYYEDKIKAKDDKPTLGIIMATEKDDTVVKYSILNDSNQLFATKYKVYLPSEEELKREIEQSKLNYKLNKNNYE